MARGPAPTLSTAAFWANARREPDGCWRFGRNKTYGMTTVDGVQIGAHRRAYQLAHGPIPHGLVVRHSCDHPYCVNPDHLSVGTQRENTQDWVRRGDVMTTAQRILTQMGASL